MTDNDIAAMQSLLNSNTTQTTSTEDNSLSSNSTDPIGSFLEKVKNGTVTADDLKSMKTTLSQIPQGPPPGNNNNSTDPIGSFLDKVKNGTVTADDISAMQSLLNSSDDQTISSADSGTVSSVSSSSSSSTTDPIGSFLDKVKNGAVTSNDLTSMETFLNQSDDNQNND